MKVKLTFEDWIITGQQTFPRNKYATPQEYIDMSTGDMHSGSTFNGEIELDQEQIEELKYAISKGFRPVMRLYWEG